MKKNARTKFLADLESLTIIFDHITNGITITDDCSCILYTNPTFTKITGYTKEEVKGENPGMLHSGHHDKNFYKKMWQEISEHGFWEGEIWNRRKSGEVYPELLTISKFAKQGAVEDCFYIAVFSDISFLEKDRDQKMHLAFFDPLTELPNRNLYIDRINQVIESTKREKNKTIAIAFMDLDKFKFVNDNYGHCVGDKLLKQVGARLKLVVRSGDTVARMGGDEFTAILPSLNHELQPEDFAQRVIESIEKPFFIEGHTINIGISIGMSFYPRDAESVENLIKNADEAMYCAKKDKTKIAYFNAVESKRRQ